MKRFFLFALLFFGSASVFAQVVYTTQHRPAGLNWQELKTQHFRIIFPDGEDSLAHRAGLILEQQYPKVKNLVGGDISSFPFVLNNFNDLSNGFVTAFNFRSEVEIPPSRSKILNPQSGDWFETVLPHELVHVSHANVKGGVIGDVIGYFWPDARRTINFFAPLGVHEGIATYYESNHVLDNGGRLNHLFFRNRFNSNFSTGNRWNLGQSYTIPVYTQPFNRHYLGGTTFTEWLQQNYGEHVTKHAIAEHYNLFFLGYGFALKRATGKWSWELYDEYEKDIAAREELRLGGITKNTDDHAVVIDLPFEGEQVQRPRSHTNNEIIFFGNFYNTVRGFYSYNTSTGKTNRLRAEFSSNDYNYDLTADGNLIFSAFRPDLIYDNTFKSDLFSYNLSSGKTTRITNKKRVFAPAKKGNKIIAAIGDGPSTNLALINNSGLVEKTFSVPNTRFLSAIPNPENPDQVAVLANRRGVQALWVTTLDELVADVSGNPTIGFDEASVFDPQWHPNGEKLLFTADLPPAMNIYEFDTESREVTQLTNSKFNAFEASYARDGSSIAYVSQVIDEFKLAVLHKDDFYSVQLSNAVWQPDRALEQKLTRPLLGSQADIDTSTWRKRAYKNNLSWLKPRGVIPVVTETQQDNTFEWGAGFFSADVLGSQSYYAEITGLQERLWWQLDYSNKSFYPGFNLSAKSDPFFNSFGFSDQNNNTFVVNKLVQEREFGISIPFQFNLRADTRVSSFLFEPGLEFEQLRFFELSANESSGFTSQYNFTTVAQFNWNLRQNRRDLQPSSGFLIFSSLEYGLNDDSLRVDFPELPTQTLTTQTVAFSNSKALFAAAFAYLSPLKKYNQSLRLDVRALTQTSALVFNTNSIVPLGFGGDIFGSSANNTIRFSSRYLIPLFYPDDGGLTVPLYLSSIYLSTFTHTLGTFGNATSGVNNLRTIVGAGLRFRLKLSNFPIDIGFGLAYEPSRSRSEFIIGEF